MTLRLEARRTSPLTQSSYDFQDGGGPNTQNLKLTSSLAQAAMFPRSCSSVREHSHASSGAPCGCDSRATCHHCGRTRFHLAHDHSARSRSETSRRSEVVSLSLRNRTTRTQPRCMEVPLWEAAHVVAPIFLDLHPCPDVPPSRCRKHEVVV